MKEDMVTIVVGMDVTYNESEERLIPITREISLADLIEEIRIRRLNERVQPKRRKEQ